MTIYPNKDGKLELDDEISHMNVKKISDEEDTMKIIPENPGKSGDKPIDGKNLELTIINEPVRIKTSLSNVDPKAVNFYADIIGTAFGIPSTLRPFAAYFCGVRHDKTTNEVFSNHGILRLKLLNQMRGRDYLEALRVVLDNPTEDTIKNLTGCEISKFDTEGLIDINSKIFIKNIEFK